MYITASKHVKETSFGSSHVGARAFLRRGGKTRKSTAVNQQSSLQSPTDGGKRGEISEFPSSLGFSGGKPPSSFAPPNALGLGSRFVGVTNFFLTTPLAGPLRLRVKSSTEYCFPLGGKRKEALRKMERVRNGRRPGEANQKKRKREADASTYLMHLSL